MLLHTTTGGVVFGTICAAAEAGMYNIVCAAAN
jgi:hypothetical protein